MMSHDLLNDTWQGRASLWDGKRSEVGQQWFIFLTDAGLSKKEGLPSMPHLWHPAITWMQTLNFAPC